MTRPDPRWLLTTVNAVREVMLKRLQDQSLGSETGRDIEMAVEELEVMWEELQGQTELLSRESDRYAEFFENAPDPYLITDIGGHIREANHAALELLRADKTELVKKPVSELVAEADRVSFLARLVGLTVPGGERQASWQCRIQPPEGEAVPVTVSVRAIPLHRSGAGGLCWLVRPG